MGPDGSTAHKDQVKKMHYLQVFLPNYCTLESQQLKMSVTWKLVWTARYQRILRMGFRKKQNKKKAFNTSYRGLFCNWFTGSSGCLYSCNQSLYWTQLVTNRRLHSRSHLTALLSVSTFKTVSDGTRAHWKQNSHWQHLFYHGYCSAICSRLSSHRVLPSNEIINIAD